MSLNWLLLLIPVALGLDWFGFNPILVFAASALSIMPLAELMGRATEALSRSLGETIGGLLNATLNNAPRSSSPDLPCIRAWCRSSKRR